MHKDWNDVEYCGSVVIALTQYISKEFDVSFTEAMEEVLSENPKAVKIAYTELGADNEYPVQVYADVINRSVVTAIVDEEGTHFFVDKVDTNDTREFASMMDFALAWSHFDGDDSFNETPNLAGEVKEYDESFSEMYSIC